MAMARQMMVTLAGEPAKNEIVEQIVKQSFTITQNTTTQQKERNICPIANHGTQHKGSLRGDKTTLRAGVISSAMIASVTDR